ncbi:hypothetical protein GCM10023115_18610 [Pontixanthobacter gangjinensis]|uniref:VWA domain-containing protein n=1 Tax=Pontixanthobacter gangjinensis TaxID=1028742 RepID=A0A6I4SN66_9SPHN|nr:VWA domain-containing protein [Pontixanthobacter gangjinensis]MXO57109.1 VWA domain-containing protein [Pontixanthobacter gangjinensis]
MKQFGKTRSLIAGALLTAAVIGIAPLHGQNSGGTTAAEDEDLVIVTATRIRQGGAQDIKQFRSISLDGAFLPRAESLTIEGLLGEHDLTLPSDGSCAQLFCVTGHAMRSDLSTRPADKYFVGLGFDSNVDGKARLSEPLSLVAVVDRSGSMTGQKIARAKEALLVSLSKMRDSDRLGIVQFGSVSEVLLPVMDVGANREKLAAAIVSIEADGSTDMESGLLLGFENAFAEDEATGRKTRIMLFTDEQPNVGNVQPQGFMGLAVAGSKRGVGLTTIGVGRDFDNALALQLSSVRGGNLFYLAQNGDARALFDREFYNMVTEVAHDVVITMTPSEGYKINAVYGVPNEVLSETPEGAVIVKVGSAFMSSYGGGVFASMDIDRGKAASEGAPLMSVAIGYVDAQTGAAGSNVESVALPAAEAPERLRAAQILVDEYLSLSTALALYHDNGDRAGAYSMIDGLSQRLDAADVQGLEAERELVRGLRTRSAALAGVGDIPDNLRPLGVIGRWEVKSQRGLEEVERGDIVELTADGQLNTYRLVGKFRGNEVNQSYQINEDQLYINYTDLVFYYRLKGDGLVLRAKGGPQKLDLRRIES